MKDVEQQATSRYSEDCDCLSADPRLHMEGVIDSLIRALRRKGLFAFEWDNRMAKLFQIPADVNSQPARGLQKSG